MNRKGDVQLLKIFVKVNLSEPIGLISGPDTAVGKYSCIVQDVPGDKY